LAEKGRKARKVTERKMGNKHLLEAGKLYIYVKAGGGEKCPRKERWAISIY
jgi:hypothetical protein